MGDPSGFPSEDPSELKLKRVSDVISNGRSNCDFSVNQFCFGFGGSLLNPIFAKDIYNCFQKYVHLRFIQCYTRLSHEESESTKDKSQK